MKIASFYKRREIAITKSAQLQDSNGENFYPVTGADKVKGLSDFLKDLLPENATNVSDGLMSAMDKEKLDSLETEPRSYLKMVSPNGSIFILSISDDGTLQIVKEENESV